VPDGGSRAGRARVGARISVKAPVHLDDFARKPPALRDIPLSRNPPAETAALCLAVVQVAVGNGLDLQGVAELVATQPGSEFALLLVELVIGIIGNARRQRHIGR